MSILLWSLEKIAEAAFEILQADPSLEEIFFFWQCQRRYGSLLQDVVDAYFLYIRELFTGTCVALSFLFTSPNVSISWLWTRSDILIVLKGL